MCVWACDVRPLCTTDKVVTRKESFCFLKPSLRTLCINVLLFQGQPKSVSQVAPRKGWGRYWVGLEVARKWLGSGSEVARKWLGSGSEVARKWSEVARLWLGSGSEVARAWLGGGRVGTLETIANIVGFEAKLDKN